MKKPTDPMTDAEREEVINLLINDWLGTLYCDAASMDFYVREWLTSGRIGFYDHEDGELIDLANDAELFEEDEA